MRPWKINKLWGAQWDRWLCNVKKSILSLISSTPPQRGRAGLGQQLRPPSPGRGHFTSTGTAQPELRSISLSQTFYWNRFPPNKSDVVIQPSPLFIAALSRWVWFSHFRIQTKVWTSRPETTDTQMGLEKPGGGGTFTSVIKWGVKLFLIELFSHCSTNKTTCGGSLRKLKGIQCSPQREKTHSRKKGRERGLIFHSQMYNLRILQSLWYFLYTGTIPVITPPLPPTHHHTLPAR